MNWLGKLLRVKKKLTTSDNVVWKSGTEAILERIDKLERNIKHDMNRLNDSHSKLIKKLR